MLGPSGSGKTTTLRLIGGFERPDAGRILLGGDGRDVAAAVRARRQHGVPGLRALPAHDGRGERRVRPEGQGRSAAAGGARGRGGARPRAAVGARRAQAGAALRRPAPARGARARARQRPAGAAPRRAARRPRPEAAPGDAGLPQGAAAGSRQDLRLRHARPGGGAGDERPHRRVQPGARRAGRLARRTSTSARRTEFVADFVGVSNIIERDGRRFTIRPEKIRMLEGQAPAGVSEEGASRRSCTSARSRATGSISTRAARSSSYVRISSRRLSRCSRSRDAP